MGVGNLAGALSRIFASRTRPAPDAPMSSSVQRISKDRICTVTDASRRRLYQGRPPISSGRIARRADDRSSATGPRRPAPPGACGTSSSTVSARHAAVYHSRKPRGGHRPDTRLARELSVRYQNHHTPSGASVVATQRARVAGGVEALNDRILLDLKPGKPGSGRQLDGAGLPYASGCARADSAWRRGTILIDRRRVQVSSAHIAGVRSNAAAVLDAVDVQPSIN